MSGPVMLMHMLLERLCSHELPRIPEPDLIMSSPEQVRDFAAMGRADGLLAPIYFFHTLHASAAIRPGDHVLDLACGPCNQLAQFAQLHPDVHFTGVDVSDTMLALARQTLDRHHIRNVTLLRDDACALSHIPDASMDCVTCTMSLHHLPDVPALNQAMQAVQRVLKPGGGVYLSDFGRLKRRATQHYFAHDQAHLQTPLFTADYLNSMRAAFSVSELRDAVKVLGDGVRLHETFLAPFMVVFRRARPHPRHTDVLARATTQLQQLTHAQRSDLKALSLWFQTSGLTPPIALH